jgi:hypothetical protein
MWLSCPHAKLGSPNTAPNCGKARCHRSSSPSSDPGLRYLELMPLSSGLGGWSGWKSHSHQSGFLRRGAVLRAEKPSGQRAGRLGALLQHEQIEFDAKQAPSGIEARKCALSRLEERPLRALAASIGAATTLGTAFSHAALFSSSYVAWSFNALFSCSLPSLADRYHQLSTQSRRFRGLAHR